jgi:hypothetical protein
MMAQEKNAQKDMQERKMMQMKDHVKWKRVK